ncbi:MAG: alpha/beta hydrolase [Ruminococcaceae bacterium]|nr:alpha/beta hydrolase [Oscillospiraceae bacterium]
MDKKEKKALLAKAQTLELDDAARVKAAGSFIDLPGGNTHYEIKGEGETVVLVHGYSTPYYIYDKLFERFVAAGYKVLRYDLLGRGLSERVKADYNPQLFARQLEELCAALIPGEPFILVGTSMGGSITTEFCRRNPGVVKKLILLAPAGMDSFKAPFYMKMCKIPGFGKWIFSKIGAKSLFNGCAREIIYSKEEIDDYQRQFAASLQYKGFVDATFSSLIHTILNTSETVKAYKAVAAAEIPMLVIWGTADRTMPYYQIERMKEICPQATYLTYEGSGHIFLYDEGERTYKDIENWLTNLK